MPALPQYADDLITRQMCATAHLDAAFAREVLEEYAADGIRSVGLPFGVNLVALVRHALAAQNRRGRRDRRLLALEGTLAAALVLGVTAVVNHHTGFGTALLLVAAAVFPVAGFVVYESEWALRRAVVDLKNPRVRAQEQVPAAEPALETGLKALRSANMVVYGLEAESENPFVGSGWRITEAVWSPFDVGRPAQALGGGTLTPLPFTAADLHHHLAKEMPKATGLSSLRARNRLYVRGPNVAALGTDALPDPTRRPLPTIPSSYVKSGAVTPGGGMETYLCLWTAGAGGQVMVSMHLRALLNPPKLSWEVAAYVLPPLGPRFRLPAEYSASESRLRLNAVRAAVTFAVPGVLGAARRALSRRAAAASRARDLERVRKEIRRGHTGYDYGSTNSLRERAAHWREMGYGERRDAQNYFKLMVQSVLSCTAAFLESRNVDTADLNHQQQQIVSLQTFNFNGVIGQLQAGAHNQMNVGQPMPPPGGGIGAGVPGNAPGVPASPAGLP
ncbi:hypothetical protein [Actinacidiphila acididurans]|uniref:Uncharacterized protein n=1 Tax=Actinacidiphila acididurans TaxID=2784346 RepID=A0ABS2U4X9_9ACTN|nr:hypothetical protein [Actinacidiphila acididurans]MBM9510670.1 hypothetical protein [Actinacidiphila acididurans]